MLTELKIKRMSATDGLVSDGGVQGLYFKASSPGKGKWVFRFVSPESRKRRDMGIGTYPDISLARARETARLHRDALAHGRDPLETKRDNERTVRASAAELTLEEATREVHKELTRGFKNRKHAAQWLTSMESYILPKLGKRKVSALRAADFADSLGAIWLSMPETAARVKQRCAYPPPATHTGLLQRLILGVVKHARAWLFGSLPVDGVHRDYLGGGGVVDCMHFTVVIVSRLVTKAVLARHREPRSTDVLVPKPSKTL